MLLFSNWLDDVHKLVLFFHVEHNLLIETFAALHRWKTVWEITTTECIFEFGIQNSRRRKKKQPNSTEKKWYILLYALKLCRFSLN